MSRNEPHEGLFAFEARWVALIFAAIFPEPPRGEVPVAITEHSPAAFYARLCRSARWDHRFILRAALWVTALVAPLVVLGRLRTLGGLSVEAREDVLAGMHGSGIYLFRQLVFLLKAQSAQVFAARPEVRAIVTGRREVASLRRPGLKVLEAAHVSAA